jgi:GDP-D-mannose dehydratase
VVNSSKTDLCLFHRNDQPEVHVRISGILVKSNKSINVLGVTFDCKLDWKEHVANTIKKSNTALYPVKMIKKFFKPNEQKLLLNA